MDLRWHFYFMKQLEWHPFYYNKLETNIMATKCGRLMKIEKYWHGKGRGCSKVKYGEINLSKIRPNNSGYLSICVSINGKGLKHLFVHQIISSIFNKYEFEQRKLVIDHIDSNKYNNHCNNLRLITQRENCSKEKVIKSGLPVGIYWNKNEKKYRASIRIGKNRVHLGYFNDLESASNAYQNALRELVN